MGKRLILHIGGSKCGSSAIQNFLSRNHTRLRKRGVLTPGLELDMDSEFKAQQIHFFQEVQSRDDREAILEARFDHLRAVMDKTRQDVLVVSAENLSLIPGLAPVLARVAGDFSAVQVIFYVRRQDDYMISAWQQWGLKTFPDFASYLETYAATYGDWNALVTPWEEAFGRERVIVRPFRRDMLTGGDVVEDFFHVLGLPLESCVPLDGPANRSFDEHLGDLAHKVQDIFDGPHDNRFYETMIHTLGEAAFKSRTGSHVMTLPQRLELLARFQDSNDAIKARYVPELGAAPLFEPPTQKDVVSLSAQEKLEAENRLLIRAVYGLSRRIDALEVPPEKPRWWQIFHPR